MPRPNADVTCSTCQAWSRLSEVVGRGRCRFNAPTDAGSNMGWPTTGEDGWCMQWTPIGGAMPYESRRELPAAPRGRRVDLD